MGKLYKRGKIYYGDYVDRDRQRVQRSLRTSDREVARARLRDLELSTTDSGPHASQALADALDWFTGTVHAGSPVGTRESYEQKARHLARLLGEYQLDALTRDRVLSYIASRAREGAHEHSVHKELVVLRGALKAAKERQPPLFHGEVAAVVPRFKTKYDPRRTHLSPEQFMALTRHLVAPLPPGAKPETVEASEARRARRVFFCMMIAFASPRLGELHKMRWEDHVDLRLNRLQIPKGKTEPRAITIAPILRPWIEAFHEQAGGVGPVVEAWGSCRRDLANACKRAGVPRVTPNDLRRTFASWLVQARESLFVVSKLLGHNSTRMVEKVYGQLTQDVLDGAVAKLPGNDCHAGVTDTAQNAGEHGARGAGASSRLAAISVEESAISGGSVVPRDGIEPPTRGFSVRCSTS
jgi:integrase